MARSADGGRSFRDPVNIDTGQLLGRVDVAQLDGDRSLVVWLARDGEQSQLRARKVSQTGELGPVATLARLSASRQTGFPRIAAMGDRALVTWTEIREDAPGIRAAIVHPR